MLLVGGQSHAADNQRLRRFKSFDFGPNTFWPHKVTSNLSLKRVVEKNGYLTTSLRFLTVLLLLSVRKIVLKLKSGRRIAASGTNGFSHVSVTAIMSGCKVLVIIRSLAILGRRLRA